MCSDDYCGCLIYVDLQDGDLRVNWWRVYLDEDAVLMTWCMN